MSTPGKAVLANLPRMHQFCGQCLVSTSRIRLKLYDLVSSILPASAVNCNRINDSRMMLTMERALPIIRVQAVRKDMEVGK